MTSLAWESSDQETSRLAASHGSDKSLNDFDDFRPGRSLDKLGNLKGMHETSSQVDKDRCLPLQRGASVRMVAHAQGKTSDLPMYLKPDDLAIGA